MGKRTITSPISRVLVGAVSLSKYVFTKMQFVCIVAPEQPLVTVQRIDSTSVMVSWTLSNGNEGIDFYLVTYRKLKDRSDEKTINTTKTEIKITGLEPDVEYEFVVSKCASLSIIYIPC